MRRLAVRALGVIAVAGVLIAAVVLTGSSDSAAGTAAPPLPRDVLVPPRQTRASLHGRPAAINFWASWCGPCREESPDLERLFRSLHGKAGLVGVDYSDDPGRARSFIREFHLTYPMLRDPDGKVGDRYGVSGLPVTAILDPHGRIAELLRGQQTEKSVRSALAPYLQ